MNLTDKFCSGSGYAMNNGFQPAFGPGSYCVLMFFQGWNVNTEGKYAVALVSMFLLGLLIEAGGYAQKRLAKRISRKPPVHALLHYSTSLLYGCQMTLAYLAMLSVMLYEIYFFVTLVTGLAIGHAVFSVFLVRRDLKADEVPREDDLAYGSHTPCCSPTTNGGGGYGTVNGDEREAAFPAVALA